MGAGKTCIGKRLAQTFGLEFVDADEEIEMAAGCSIEDIFARYGESHFRDGERRVIARLLDCPVHVLATGGGAFMDPRTREKIRERGISVWLRADIELLLRRVSRRNNRPLLKHGDQRATLERLIALRYPIYAEADIAVDSLDASPDATAERVVAALRAYLASNASEQCERRQQATP
ncbi:MAG TPA: shikimate kinase [Alphaproteobacteria bacterium]|nr:shikimate kinase [Alphaproteobacteria bacterium]